MTDAPEGSGWQQAADGKWYPAGPASDAPSDDEAGGSVDLAAHWTEDLTAGLTAGPTTGPTTGVTDDVQVGSPPPTVIDLRSVEQPLPEPAALKPWSKTRIKYQPAAMLNEQARADPSVGEKPSRREPLPAPAGPTRWRHLRGEPTKTTASSPEGKVIAAETRKVVPGFEPQPGHEWSRGIDGNWYPRRVPRARPRPLVDLTPAPLAHARVRSRRISLVGVFTIAIFAALLAALVLGLADYFRENKKSSVSGQTALAIGATGRTADVDVTVNGVSDRFQPANPAEAAAPGTRYVAIDVTLHNTRTGAGVDMPTSMFQLTDSTGFATEQAAPSDLPQVAGTLLPDEVRRGFVTFRISDASPPPLQLRVKGESNARGVLFTIQ